MPVIVDKVKSFKCRHCRENIDAVGMPAFESTACPHCGEMVNVPAAFSNYLLRERLGDGVSAMVFRAYEPKIGREVALKVFNDDQESRKQAERCIHEARIIASFNHPRIVQIFHIGLHKGQSYIEMELIPGGNTKFMTNMTPPPNETMILDFAIGAVEGLNAAFRAGVVHGDVKPANILVTFDSEAKLIDFGAAFRYDESEDSGQLGTPHYLAPEVIKREPTGFWSDMYSLGATLFHMLAQQPPFNAETVREIAKLKLQYAAPPIIELRPDLNEYTAYAIDRMLQMEPSERFESWEDLLEVLHQARDIAPPPADDVVQLVPISPYEIDENPNDQNVGTPTPNVEQPAPPPDITPNPSPAQVSDQLAALAEQVVDKGEPVMAPAAAPFNEPPLVDDDLSDTDNASRIFFIIAALVLVLVAIISFVIWFS